MKSKEQKIQEVQAGKKLLEKNQSLIFVNFEKIHTAKIVAMKIQLKKLGGKFMVIKKRLLRLIFKEKQINFDPQSAFNGQIGVVFMPDEIEAAASPVYKIFQELKFSGAYSLKDKQFLDTDLFKKMALLPSREILLSQLVGILSAPLKMFLFVLQEKSKQQTVDTKQ